MLENQWVQFSEISNPTINHKQHTSTKPKRDNYDNKSSSEHLFTSPIEMSAWGQGGSLKSCDSLLKRVERNDNNLTELVILPMKTFGGAELDRLSDAIANGSNTILNSISASGHNVPSESLKRFGSALSIQSKQLAESNYDAKLGINHIAIGSKDMGDNGVVALCEGLGASNGGRIQSLDLGWKNIGKDGIRKIASTFAKSSYISELNLSRNENIGCSGLSSFCVTAHEAVGANNVPFKSIEAVILSECNIGAFGVESLAECIGGRNLKDGECKMIQLNISSNPIGASGCDSIQKMLARPSTGSIVSKLQLAQCNVSDEGITTLSSAAKNYPCVGLTTLDLSNNSISQDGAKVFAESLLESWPDLAELNLAKNDLGSTGVVMIMQSLLKRNDVESDHPVISNETIMVMKSLIHHLDIANDNLNSTLKTLDLTETNCGIEGACAALMSGGLTSLRLFNNKLGSDGFYSIAKLLRGGHPTIEHLDVGGNNADEDAVVALLDAIGSIQDGKSRGSALTVLEIGGNAFGDDADAALKRLKKVWPMLDVAHDKPVKREVAGE